MPVTSLAARLPDVEVVRRWSEALAALDAILSPEWEYRYFSFAADWAPDVAMASMRNGSGDDYSIVFSADGAWARGFDHESELSPYEHSPPAVWPGVLDGVPPEFAQYVDEPAFCDLGVARATVCLWRRAGDAAWRHGQVTLPSDDVDPDGADWLFAELDGRAETYRDYALEYFEREVDLAAISHVYRHEPISDAVVAALNPALTLADIADDLHEIGFRPA
jgi:hypothetical protein